MSRDEIIAKVEGIASDERFKMERFFMCGSPTGMPNEKLMRACDGYLKTVRTNEKSDDAVSALIDELEAATHKKEVAGVTVSNGNLETIHEILKNRNLLYN